MQTVAELEEKAAATLKSASDWKAKGNARMELSCVGSVLRGLLEIAVTYHDAVEAGVAYLRGRHAEELLARYHELNSGLLNDFLADPRRARAAIDNDVTFTHIGWLLNRHALGDAILQIVCNAEVATFAPLTRFWTEYGRAMACLVARQLYVPQPPAKLKGYEKHWATYLDLVAALTAGGDTRTAAAACALSFARRNRDKRLSNAALFDGTGHLPVRWDVRAWSILGRWSAQV
jgi:hypothetical protein